MRKLPMGEREGFVGVLGPWAPGSSLCGSPEQSRLPKENQAEGTAVMGGGSIVPWTRERNGERSCCCSVAHLCLSFATPWTQHARLPCPSLSPWVCLDLCPLSRWSSSVVPFSSYPQSFPASGSFLMSQPFASDGQSIGVSASASVLPMNIQGCFPLGLTGWISLLSKGLSRVFSSTTIRKHQFFSTQPS